MVAQSATIFCEAFASEVERSSTERCKSMFKIDLKLNITNIITPLF